MSPDKLIFAAYAESDRGLYNICRLTESLRTFGGRFNAVPVSAYIPHDASIEKEKLMNKLQSLQIEVHSIKIPEDAVWFYYAGKVYAAAEAERAAAGKADILAWLDEDTIFLDEPTDFDLTDDKSFAYCPVMHNRSGSLYDAPPDTFWRRIYEMLSITDEQLFPMTTPADGQKIRAYFQAGLLVVRPEKGILQKWKNDFKILYQDSELAEMCRADVNKRVFLHQTALVGAVLNNISPEEMQQLTDRYNYPIFFERRYDAVKPFKSIEDSVTIRTVVSSDDLGDDWHRELAGPPNKIAWLKEHLQ